VPKKIWLKPEVKTIKAGSAEAAPVKNAAKVDAQGTS